MSGTGEGDVGMTNADVCSGAPAGQLVGAVWRKSSYSGKQGNCVELARLPDGNTALRNSRDPCGPALIHSANHLAGFVIAVKDGELDGVHARPNRQHDRSTPRADQAWVPVHPSP